VPVALVAGEFGSREALACLQVPET